MTMEAKIRPWLLWILIGVVLIGGGFAYWYLSGNKGGTTTTTSPTPTLSSAKKSPTADETADWQTYKNDTYGFSFKYPKDWELKEYKEQNTVSVSKATDSFAVNYYDSVANEPENKSNNYGATTIDELVVKDPMITDEQKTTFAGKEAYEAVWGGMGAYYSIIINDGGKLIVINFGNKAKKSDLTSIQNQILSTFQFTK